MVQVAVGISWDMGLGGLGRGVVELTNDVEKQFLATPRQPFSFRKLVLQSFFLPHHWSISLVMYSFGGKDGLLRLCMWG